MKITFLKKMPNSLLVSTFLVWIFYIIAVYEFTDMVHIIPILMSIASGVVVSIYEIVRILKSGIKNSYVSDNINMIKPYILLNIFFIVLSVVFVLNSYQAAFNVTIVIFGLFNIPSLIRLQKLY